MNRLKEFWRLLHTKEYKNTRKIYFRAIIYILLFFLVDYFHETYTQSLFNFAVRTSDGFVNFLPYIFLGVFFVLRFRNFSSVPKLKRQWWEGIFFTLCSIYFFAASTKFDFLQSDAERMFMQSAYLLCGYSSLFILLFTLRFVRYFFTDLLLIVLLLIPTHLAPIIIDHFWEYSSRVTLFGISLFLHILPVDSAIVADQFLVRVKDFSVIVGPPCAGIHSLTAFTILYSIIVLLINQKQKIHNARAFGFYFLGLVLVFLLNSIRVLSIIFVGVYYSKEFAVNLFHETIGSVLLLTFFILYTSWVIPKIGNPQNLVKSKKQ